MIRRYIRVFKYLLQFKLSRQMIYSFNFWTAVLVDIFFFFIQMAAFSTIFLQVDSINGWSQYHMIIFIGTFTILDGLYMGTYFFGVIDIADKIRTGRLDMYITKPINTLFFISFENMNIGSLLIAIPGIFMVAYGALQLGIEVSIIKALGYIFLISIMYLLMYNLMVLFRCTAFWFTKTDFIGQLENELVNFSFRVP